MRDRPKRIGLIGCGAVTQESYVPTLRRMADRVQVVGVTDTEPGRASEVAKAMNAQVFGIDDLAAAVDEVIIATPPSTHFDLAMQCLAQGKSVVCEKPFVCTRSEAVALLAEASRHGARIRVAQVRRLYPAAQTARALLASGVLGNVVRIEAFEGGRFMWIARSGYTHIDPYGGVLFDTGSHVVDTALYGANLDTAELSAVDDISVSKLSGEPAHSLEASCVIAVGAKAVEFQLKLSRLEQLANFIKWRCEHGDLMISTAPRGDVVLMGSGGVVTTRVQDDALDHERCFAYQCEHLFGTGDGDLFDASRVIGQVTLLEAIYSEKQWRQ